MAQNGRTSTPRNPGAGGSGGSGKAGKAGKAGRRRVPRRVLWRRRAIALVVLAGLVVGIGWGAVLLFGVVKDSIGSPAAAQPSATPTAPSTAQPVACAPDSLTWSLTHDAGTAGAAVDFAITVTNGSELSCLVDGGAQTLVLAIVSGTDPIWSNAHCGSADPFPLLLGPGDSTERTVTWDGARSAAGCVPVESPVLPGTYQLTTSYAGIDVPAGAAVFTLN